MSDLTYWGWVAKGLGGVLNILRMLVEDESRPSEHWLSELRLLRERLDALIRQIEGYMP